MPDYPLSLLSSIVDELVAAPKFNFNTDLRRNLVSAAGIYRISSISDDPASEIYTGKSGNLRQRIYGNHLRGTVDNSTLTRKLVNLGIYADSNAVHTFLAEKCVVQFLVIPDDRLRCFAEHYAIAVLQPAYND